MRGSAALEAMLIASAFFAVIGIVSGLFVELTRAETRIGGKLELSSDAERIADAVNAVYLLGPENRIALYVNEKNFTVESDGGRLTVSRGALSAHARTFTEATVESIGGRIEVSNEGGTIRIRAE